MVYSQRSLGSHFCSFSTARLLFNEHVRVQFEDVTVYGGHVVLQQRRLVVVFACCQVLCRCCQVLID